MYRRKDLMKKYTKTSLIMHFLKGSVRFFVISTVVAFAVTLFEMLIPQLVRFTVDSVIGNETPSGFFASLPESIQANLNLVSIAVTVGILALIVGVCRFVHRYCTVKGSESLVKTMRDELFAVLQKLPFSWHMKNRTGDIIQRCTSDVERVTEFISEQLVSIVRIVILIAIGLVFMFSMNVKLSLIAVVAIPIMFSYSLFFHGRISSHFKECDETEGVLSSIAQENLTGVRVVRAFGREKEEINRFDGVNSKYASQWVKLIKFMSLYWSSGDLLSGLQIMSVLVLGTVLCVKGELSAGELIAFISYNSMTVWPVRYLGRVVSELSKTGVSVDRIIYIMNSETETDRKDAYEPELDGDIEFKNVSFSYDDGTNVLKNVSLKVKKGTTLGIIGATGSGKTSLVHLINRLYELPESDGTVTVNGVDVRDIKLHHLRKNIGMVLQEPFLFSGTVRENISAVNGDATDEEIRRAASIADVDEAISEFPSGYNTVVGERGVTLSGGQKQRVAIARMLMQHAPIMVFDDSLSAVDAETDARIRGALKSELKDSTVFIISHRVTTVMHADSIIVLENGRIAEEGTHSELMGKNGIYRRIYDLQMSVTEEE